MYCSRCGKKVLDSMLFCPFCGAEIVVPDQGGEGKTFENPAPVIRDYSFDFDAAAEEDEVPKSDDAAPEPVETPDEPSLAPELLAEAEDIDEDLMRYLRKGAPEKATPAPDKAAPASESPRREAASDMFMEEEAPEAPEDDFDAYENALDRARRERKGRRYRQEDEEDDDEYHSRSGGLVVALVLFLIIAAAAIYGFSTPGQTMLARLDLPLPIVRPATYARLAQEADQADNPAQAAQYYERALQSGENADYALAAARDYGRLGYEAYRAGNYILAGDYYERALSKMPDSYDYAASAAMSYISAGERDRATQMLIRCTQLKPDTVDAYIRLQELYPDAATRPEEIRTILEEGYRLTGDGRLK